MDPASSMQIAVLVVLIMLSAFFSGTETAFTSFNKTRMKTLAQDGNKKAKAVMDVDEHYTKFISTMLVGNNIVNILSSSLATTLFMFYFRFIISDSVTALRDRLRQQIRPARCHVRNR